MENLFLFLPLSFLCNIIHAQEQLNISQAISYKVACSGGNLNGYWLDVFGKKVMEQEYTAAKNSNDEFKLNMIKKKLSDRYDGAIKTVGIGKIYYVTELIDNYSYDFASSSVKIEFGQTNKYDYLDVYEEGGVRRNYMTRGLESDNNPEFRISNADNIPILFQFLPTWAEKSFAQRKSTVNRHPFKLRYYFKFWQCGSKFGTQNFGGHICDVEVIKVELIDDIISKQITIDVQPGEQPN